MFLQRMQELLHEDTHTRVLCTDIHNWCAKIVIDWESDVIVN